MSSPTVEQGRAAPPLAFVALAASAGGVTALSRVVSALPADLDAAVLVVLHLQPDRHSLLASILDRGARLPVTDAVAGERLEARHVYVAPADAHLAVADDGTFVLDTGPPIHYLRPSADVLLASLAHACDADRLLAAVLTGTGSDGADGARAVKAAGGRVIAQDEETSDYFGMPSAAIATGAVDEVLPLAAIGPAVTAFVRRCADGRP